MDLRTAVSYVLVFIVFVVSLGIGATILSNVRSTQTSGSIAYNASTDGLTGVDNISDWSPTIGTVMGASIVLTILVGAFAFALTRK